MEKCHKILVLHLVSLHFLLVLATLFVTACVKVDCESGSNLSGCSSSNDAAKVDIGGDVDFTGYVQRAFDIHVNNQPFTDTEHLYTRFIEDLILTNDDYKTRFADTQIEVEGDYGVASFATNSLVYLSSEASDGHIFQARTSGEAKFSVRVKKAAQDESFKARVIARIGLKITYADKSVEHFCYLLHGRREGISINESTKPIIFDDFFTQLNSFKCSDLKEETLVIPAQADTAPAEEVAPKDDAGVVVDAETGEAKSEPQLKIKQTIELASPLGANETGSNTLETAFFSASNKKFYFYKSEVTNKDDGRQYKILLSGESLEELTRTEVKKSLSAYPILNYAFGENYFGYSDGNAKKDLKVYDSNFSEKARTTIGSETNTIIPAFFELGGEPYLIRVTWDYYRNPLRASVCKLDFGAASILSQCINPPASNSAPGVEVSGAIQFEGYFYFLNETRIWAYNKNLVYQKSYGISTLSFYTTELSKAKIFTDGKDIILASMIKDKIIVRFIELVD